MLPHVVDVTAPSRLHFGMFSFGQPGVRQFGGVGAMIDRPCLRLRLSPAERLSMEAPPALIPRIQTCVERFSELRELAELPACRIEVVEAPRQHAGLGSGTQLAMSVAAGLEAMFPADKVPDAAAIARRAGRGLRSEIGLHGFLQGGLLVESGKLPGEERSTLLARATLPAQWRFVLLCPAQSGAGPPAQTGEPTGQFAYKPDAQASGSAAMHSLARRACTATGLHGDHERRAFERLPAVPLSVTDQLCREVLLQLLPTAREERFDEFAESLFRFGHLAGLCFASEQTGAFASDRLQRLVDLLRSHGIRGVGQSSLGPTLFALVAGESEAQSLVEWLQCQPEADELELIVAAPAGSGATVTTRLA